MTDIVIQTKNLTKSYKNTEVLKGVDLHVRRGQIFALLGSNGAGKTTAVNILSTLLTPDSGSATVCGFDTSTQPERVREKISLTGQFAAVDASSPAGRTSCSSPSYGPWPTLPRSPTACFNSSG